MTYVRVFESGAREHRADEIGANGFGADAYTDENVTPDFKGQAWVVVDLEQYLIANPYDTEAGNCLAIAEKVAAGDDETPEPVLRTDREVTVEQTLLDRYLGHADAPAGARALTQTLALA